MCWVDLPELARLAHFYVGVRHSVGDARRQRSGCRGGAYWNQSCLLIDSDLGGGEHPVGAHRRMNRDTGRGLSSDGHFMDLGWKLGNDILEREVAVRDVDDLLFDARVVDLEQGGRLVVAMLPVAYAYAPPPTSAAHRRGIQKRPRRAFRKCDVPAPASSGGIVPRLDTGSRIANHWPPQTESAQRCKRL